MPGFICPTCSSSSEKVFVLVQVLKRNIVQSLNIWCRAISVLHSSPSFGKILGNDNVRAISVLHSSPMKPYAGLRYLVSCPCLEHHKLGHFSVVLRALP